MRTRKSSPFLLLVSLALGLSAMWIVASPVGATGDFVTGGFWVTLISGKPVAASWSSGCGECRLVWYASCDYYAGGLDCSGGSVPAISCARSEDAWGVSGAGSPGYCSGDPGCEWIHGGSCFY